MRISEWAYQWKMSFNPDPSKQAVEVYFTRKSVPPDVPIITFNNTAISSSDHQKHLGLILDNRLTFDLHLEQKFSKANRGIGLINRLRKFLPRNSLLTIYKSFIRPHLDYGDIVYDYPENAYFVNKIEAFQYNACLAITGCFRGTSREKLYSELGLESLADRRFIRRMVFFYKIVNKLAPQYLYDYLPTQNVVSANLRSRPPIRPLAFRTERYRNSFFPFCISQWNKLDSHIRNLPSISSFKQAITNFLKPKPSLIFGVQNIQGVVYLNRLRVGFSHLREHKFRHGFLDTLDPFCNCRTNSIETTEHFLLHCSNFINERHILFDNLRNLNICIFPLSSFHICKLLIYGDPKFSNELNRDIIISTIEFICSSDRFSGTLF